MSPGKDGTSICGYIYIYIYYITNIYILHIYIYIYIIYVYNGDYHKDNNKNMKKTSITIILKMKTIVVTRILVEFKITKLIIIAIKIRF